MTQAEDALHFVRFVLLPVGTEGHKFEFAGCFLAFLRDLQAAAAFLVTEQAIDEVEPVDERWVRVAGEHEEPKAGGCYGVPR